MQKLAIITTHPVQYNAPLFKLLHQRKQIEIKVFYTWSQTEAGLKYDPGFGKHISWDVPLLNGYPYLFSYNSALNPGSHHKKGIKNPNLITEINTWGANAILVYGWNFEGHQSVINFFYKKLPLFFRGDSTLLGEQFGMKKIIRRIYLKFIYSKFSVALYAGEANKAYFLAHGFKKGQLVFMPHAIENERFYVNPQMEIEVAKFKSNLGIKAEATVFLFVGKLDKNKNIELLIETFLKLNNVAHLIIAGSGKLEHTLVSQNSNQKNIHFIGFVNQQTMPAIYNSCHVFILPSKSETWGLAINEAMAAGKAIIASNTCGAAYDLVKHNKNGFVIDLNIENSLYSAMYYFLNNKNAAAEMGLESLKLIQPYSYVNDSIALENALIGKLEFSY